MIDLHIYYISCRNLLMDYLMIIRDPYALLLLLLYKRLYLVSINHSTWNQQLLQMCMMGFSKVKIPVEHSSISILKLGRFQCKLNEWSVKVDRFGAGCSVPDCVNAYHWYTRWTIDYSLSRKLMDPAVVLGHVVCWWKSCCKTLWWCTAVRINI